MSAEGRKAYEAMIEAVEGFETGNSRAGRAHEMAARPGSAFRRVLQDAP